MYFILFIPFWFFKSIEIPINWKSSLKSLGNIWNDFSHPLCLLHENVWHFGRSLSLQKTKAYWMIFFIALANNQIETDNNYCHCLVHVFSFILRSNFDLNSIVSRQRIVHNDATGSTSGLVSRRRVYRLRWRSESSTTRGLLDDSLWTPFNNTEFDLAKRGFNFKHFCWVLKLLNNMRPKVYSYFYWLYLQFNQKICALIILSVWVKNLVTRRFVGCRRFFYSDEKMAFRHSYQLSVWVQNLVTGRFSSTVVCFKSNDDWRVDCGLLSVNICAKGCWMVSISRTLNGCKL